MSNVSDLKHTVRACAEIMYGTDNHFTSTDVAEMENAVHALQEDHGILAKIQDDGTVVFSDDAEASLTQDEFNRLAFPPTENWIA